MTKTFYFTIAGKVQPKERPRKSRHLKMSKKGKPYHPWFTPKNTMDYEEKVRLCFRELYPLLNDKEHRWRLEIWTNKEGVTVRATQLGRNEPKYTGADHDNISKIISDSLQGLVFANDNQVTEAHIYLENQKE